METTPSQDTPASSSRPRRPRYVKKQTNRYDKPTRPLRKIEPKTIVSSKDKDPKEGAYAAEIRDSAEELGLLSATLGLIEPASLATDSSLDGEYSTDDEYYFNLQHGHNLSPNSLVEKTSAENLRTGAYNHDGYFMRSVPLPGPDIMVTNPTGPAENYERAQVDEFPVNSGYDNTAGPSKQPSSFADGPSQRGLQLRRSPRHHRRRPTPEASRHRCSPRQDQSSLSEHTYSKVDKGKAPEVVRRIAKGKAPEVIHRMHNAKPPGSVGKLDKGKAPELAHSLESGIRIGTVRNAKRKAPGIISEVDKGKGTGSVVRSEKKRSRNVVRWSDNEKAPDILNNIDVETIDPVIPPKDPNLCPEYIPFNHQADMWAAEHVGNMNTDDLRLQSNFDPEPGVYYQKPTTDNKAPYPTSVYDVIEGQIRSEEEVLWSYDPEEYGYFEYGHLIQANADGVWPGEMSETLATVMNTPEVVASGSGGNETDGIVQSGLDNDLTHGLAELSVTYDWGIPEGPIEETELPESNALGYFVDLANDKGESVRTFFPYTEDDWPAPIV